MGLFRRLFHRKPPSDTERVSQWEQTLNPWPRSARLRAQVETEVGDPSDGETVVSERVEWRGSDGETAVGEPSDGETVISEPVRWRRSYGKTMVRRPQSVAEQSDSKTVIGEPSDGETVVSEPVRWRRSYGKTVVRRPQSDAEQSDSKTVVGEPSDDETVVREPVRWRRSDGRTVAQRAQSVGEQSDGETDQTVVSDRVIRRRYFEALVGEPSDDETVARWRQSVGETVISERVQRRRSDGETVVGEQWEGETVVSERVRWRRSNGKAVVRRPRSVGGQSDGQTVVSERVPWRPSDFQTVVPDLSDGEPLDCDPSCSEPLDNLVQISDRVYVFDSCFSTNVLEEDECKYYMDSTLGMLQCYFPDAAFMAFNFRRANHRDQISDILSEYNVKLMDFPTDYGGFPLLPLQMIRNFLWSSVSWLLLEGLSGMNNVLLLHCERGGWPVLAFMLAALLLYRGHYTEEQKTLEMVYKLAPRELLPLPLPLNPQPSHLRYLRYITGRDSALGWPPMDKPFNLECLVLNMVPDFDGEGGCRPMVRVYGQDPSTPANGGSKLLFSTPNIWYYRQEEFTIMKLNVCCRVQGDVVIECIHMDEDLEHEERMFRFMFNTAFVQSDILLLNREEIDVAWNAKDQFQEDFKVEILTFPLEVYGNGHLGMGDSRSQYRDNAGKVLDDSTSSSDCNYPPTPTTQVFHSGPSNSKETIAETAKQLDESTKLLAPRTQRSSPAALEDGLIQFEKDIERANSAVKSNISKLITRFKRLEVAKSQQSLSGDEPLSTAEIHSRKNQTGPSNGKVDHSSNKLNHAVLASANDKDTVSVPLLDGRGAADLATTPTNIGVPVSLPKVDEGVLSPEQFDPQQNDGADLECMRCQVKLGEEMQQESSCTNEEGAHVLHPVCITSPSYLIEKVGESLQVENPAPEMEENPGEIISEHQESTIGESGALVIHSSVGKIDLSNLQEMDNADLVEIKELGSGGFGTVYHGKWRGIDVAIKRIKKSCIVDEQSGQDRLILESLREAGILSKVQHPNVVSLHGFVLHESASTLAIVMELVRGGSLRSILHRGEKYLDHCKKLTIAKGAASGMEYLHLKNIVHFDLKCDNLLVDLKDPSWPICKVTDFGLSKIKENSLVSGSFRGTLPWMAPELFKRGNNKVSEKVDVYSFGIVMWEILTGQVPYAGMRVGDILGGICDDTLRPPVPASCDPKWRELMEECWHRDPPQRPSFAEISSRLHWMLMVSQAEASK